MPVVAFEELTACPQLPSLPSVAMQVVSLSQDPDVQIPQIAEIIQNDQALTAKILKTVNSSYYGLSQRCETINRAMTFLGLNTIKSLVLGFSLVRIGNDQPSNDLLIQHWRRAIYGAAAARRLAQELEHCDPEEAFIAALMQDIGCLAMYAAMRDSYSQLVKTIDDDHFKLAAIEQKELGFDHAKVGAALGDRWRLPEALIDIIRHHHDHENGSHLNLLRTITLGTQIADVISSMSLSDEEHKPQDDESSQNEAFSTYLTRLNASAADWYDMNPQHTCDLLQQIAAEAKAFADLLEVNVGSHPDVTAIMSKAEEVALMHQLQVEQETRRLQQQNQTLSHIATTCALTGLANRRRFDEELIMRFQQAKERESSLSLIFIDADNFKMLNDTHGHQVGDVTLVEMARRIESAIPDAAIACRYGGEEFVVLLPGINRIEAARIAETIRESVCATPIDLSDVCCDQSQVEATVSLGVAAFDPQTSDLLINPLLLTKAADRALYQAKLNGRNQVQVFAPAKQKSHAA